MRSYRTKEEVPWKDVLEMLYWCLGVQVRHTRHQLEWGDLRAAASMILQLRRRNACAASLRRFLSFQRHEVGTGGQRIAGEGQENGKCVSE